MIFFSSSACSASLCARAAIAFLCAYEGYHADAGAEGVGKSTASAVVITSVAILVLDALTAITTLLPILAVLGIATALLHRRLYPGQ
mgnify:CR=1 FL=1